MERIIIVVVAGIIVSYHYYAGNKAVHKNKTKATLSLSQFLG